MIIPYAFGIKNIVASLGTALTIEQINLIKRYTENVVLIFDADRSGQLATLRALDLLLENDLKVKVVKMSKGMDPAATVSEKGKDYFLELLKRKS